MLAALRSGVLGLGPYARRFEEEFAAFCGTRARGRGLERHGRPAPAGARRGHRRGRRGHHRADLVRRLGQRDALRARDRPSSPTSTRARSCSTRPPSRRPSRRARAGSCRCTCSATRATWRRSARSPSKHGLAVIEDACEAVGSVRAGRRVGSSRQPGGVRVLSQQADDDGRGRHGHDRRPRARRAAALARQPGPLGHGRLARARPARLQLPHGRALGRRRPGADRAPRRDPGRARRGRRALRRACSRASTASRSRPRPRPATSAPGSSTSCASTPRSIATRSWRRCRRAAWPASPTCPPSTCSRSTAASGHRAGRVPVAEADRALDARAAVPHAARRRRPGLRRRLPRRRARLSDAPRAAASRSSSRRRPRATSSRRRAGRRVTAWLEFPAARATHARRRLRAGAATASSSPTAPGASVQVVYDGRLRGQRSRATRVAAPLAGADTVLYAVADGRHADLAAASLRAPRRAGSSRSSLRRPGGPPPYALAGPEAVWYTAGALRARPPDI